MSETANGREFVCEFSASAQESVGRATVGDHHVLFDESDAVPGSAGEQEYPSPVEYLLSSLVGCQVSVLEQALHLAGVDEYEVDARGEIERFGAGDVPEMMPEHTAARVEFIDVEVTLTVPPEDEDAAKDCLDSYNAGCIVGQSLTDGIEYTSRKSVVPRAE